MSDTSTYDGSGKMLPPERIDVPEPKSMVRYAEVLEGGRFVGAVWVAENPTARPRAGIVLARNQDPSVLLQDDLGTLTLGYSTDGDLVAEVWLDDLAAARTGVGGTLAVGEAGVARSLEALRQLVTEASPSR